MRDQLIRYVELLFAGAPEAGEVRQEILQNTLDRYDDLVAQGKSPQAAYRLAISGIGDIGEILGAEAPGIPSAPETSGQKPLRAIAIALYILSPLPLFLLQNEWGLCGLLLVVAIATMLLLLTGKSRGTEVPAHRSPLRRSAAALIWAVALCLYFPLSFVTSGWAITWLLFPLANAVQGLVFACMDLKEVP